MKSLFKKHPGRIVACFVIAASVAAVIVVIVFSI